MNRLDCKLIMRKSSLVYVVLLYFCATAKIGLGDMWMNHGGGILNHRSAIGSGQIINASSISNLRLKWRFKTGFDVSATPSLAGKIVYFPGWNRNLYALHAETGAVVWEKNLTQIVGMNTLSRATPVIYKHLLLVGLHGPSILLALNRHCGSLVWQTLALDASPMSIITMSGMPFEGFYYVGLSSLEEFVPTCCTFQGSFQKIRLRDGHVMWKVPMVPPNSGFFGVAVWGSSPPIDKTRRLIFIGTGNTYKVPEAVEECEKKYQNSTRHDDMPDPCIVEGVYEDSLLALHIDNGTVAWSRQLQSFDVWTLPCSKSQKAPNCPSILGPDFDFGEAPMLLDFGQLQLASKSSGIEDNKCLIIAGQKSGVVWALECETGKIIWSTAAGPGGSLGGTSWGASTDGERIYINIINNGGKNFTLAPSKQVTKGGGWVALEAHTGKVVWTTAEPSGAKAFGPMSTANGVVFGGSSSPTGDLYALDSLTGSILWNSSTGSSIYGGFAISSHCLFGGNGYTNVPIGTSGSFFSAFCIAPCLTHSNVM